MNRAIGFMQRNSGDKAFDMLLIEHLWDEQISAVHLSMLETLGDEAVAWPNDSRRIRRCDLSAHYFRMYVGESRWDTAKALAADIAERDKFRTRVREFIDEHGLP